MTRPEMIKSGLTIRDTRKEIKRTGGRDAPIEVHKGDRAVENIRPPRIPRRFRDLEIAPIHMPDGGDAVTVRVRSSLGVFLVSHPLLVPFPFPYPPQPHSASTFSAPSSNRES
jgi:hypothetical protein